MNNQRRKRLSEAKIRIGIVVDIINNELDNERDELYNLPENLEASDLYCRKENAADSLEDVIDSLNDAIDEIESAMSS